MNLNVKAFGLAGGLIWGLGLFLLTWWIIAIEGSSGVVPFLGLIYRGYRITPLGSVIGLVWGLIDGFVSGIIFAWLYNCLAAKCPLKEA
ncbi:MAG: bacteriophage holin [Candidatus Omnitrophota bacterium]